MERNWRVKGLEGSWKLSRKNLKPGEPDGRWLQVLGRKASMGGGSSGRIKREGRGIEWKGNTLAQAYRRDKERGRFGNDSEISRWAPRIPMLSLIGTGEL